MMLKMEKNKIKKFEVNIYFNSFCTYQVEAVNKDEAIIKARKLRIDESEILVNLENWQEADNAEPVRK